LSINPNNAMTLYNIATGLFNSGQPVQALPYIDRALSINPNNVYAWANKAVILNALGRFMEAAECLNRARQLGFIG
jgi:tetratricopeptide (TPR) repeat protein